MKIAIQKRKNSYSDEWIKYCEKKNIPFKIVDCYKSDIIAQLEDCDALMWHFHHKIPNDILCARQLMFSLESAGKYVFPDFNTMWHFDDKIGQKYQLEAINAPLVPSYVFYSKTEALDWINTIEYPIVFKLRNGASSFNVKLVRTEAEAKQLVKQAFGSGFNNQMDPLMYLKESIRKYHIGETKIGDILREIYHLTYRTEFEKFYHKQKGYIYFQDFIPNNDFDTRIVVVDKKAFGARRFVRNNDFRASGSHVASYDTALISLEAVRIALDVSKKLKLQCMAFDFVFKNGKPILIEYSYGTDIAAYKPCPGFWDSDLNFHEQEFNFCEWMVDWVVREVNNKSSI